MRVSIAVPPPLYRHLRKLALKESVALWQILAQLSGFKDTSPEPEIVQEDALFRFVAGRFTGYRYRILRDLYEARGRIVQFYSLVDRYWPDVEGDRGNRNLYVGISRIGHIIPVKLERGVGYYLPPESLALIDACKLGDSL